MIEDNADDRLLIFEAIQTTNMEAEIQDVLDGYTGVEKLNHQLFEGTRLHSQANRLLENSV